LRESEGEVSRVTTWVLLVVCLASCDNGTKRNHVEVVSGGHTRLVWWRHAGGNDHHLMAYDSSTGEERVLLGDVPGRGPDYPPGLAFITHDGERIVFSTHGERLVKVMDWDGSGIRVVASGYLADILYDEVRDTEWAYVLTIPQFAPIEPVVRYDIDNPYRQETVWTNTVTWEFRVSGDGEKAAVSCPWPDVGMGELSDGKTLQRYSTGCWADVSPDSQHRFVHFIDGNHRQIRAYDDNAENPRTIELGDVIARAGEGLFMLWSNHPSFLTVSAPWKSANCDLYLLRMDAGLTKIEDFAVLGGNNGTRDQSGSAWIDPGGESDVGITSFSASPAAILPGEKTALSWFTENAEFVSIEPGIGQVEECGQLEVSLWETTAYVLSANGTAGPVMRRLTVDVLPLREADEVEGLLDGLSAEYYALAAPEKLPDFSSLEPCASGKIPYIYFEPTLANFATSGRNYDVGAVFSGFIQVPADGLYTFYLQSDDGSRLFIGTDTVVDNDFLHPLIERSGSVGLKAGRHPIRVVYFDKGGEAGLIAGYAGPDIPRRVIPASSFFRMPMPTRLQIDPVLLSFSSVVGDAHPPGQVVDVSNAGDGVLEPVEAAIGYQSGGVDWLSISREGEGNIQTLRHEVLPEGLAEDRHSAMVTLSCGNVAGPPSVYPVSLTVTNQSLVLDRIEVEPTTAIIEAGESVELTARGQDQFGSPFEACMDWSVDGGGTMFPETSGDAVFAHVSSFISDGKTGRYNVRAISEGISGTSTIEVVDGRFPRISLFEPVTGDRWETGSIGFVRWESRGVDSVRIYLSSDGGETWTLLVPAVDIHNDEWGNYPLVVPDTLSSQCIIQVEGYFQETFAVSGIFSIVNQE
jgi:hypothetical protein